MKANPTRIPRWVLAATLGASLAASGTAWAEDASISTAVLLKRIEELEKQVKQLQGTPSAIAAQTPLATSTNEVARIDSLEQKVKVIERKDEIANEAAAEKAKTTPVVTVGSNGLTVRTPDTNFLFRVRGYVQVDDRLFLGDSAGTDSLLLRRVRPIFEGTVYDRFDYRVMLDLGSGQSLSVNNNNLVQDAYVNARITPGLQVRVGKDKEPVGLERLQSGANLLFVERAFPTLLVPNRDVGVQLRGEAYNGALEYQTGVFNGTANGGSIDYDNNADKDVAGRVFTQPFKNGDSDLLRGFGVGIAGTIGNQDGTLRNLTSPGQQPIFSYLSGTGATNSPLVRADGQNWRVTPQGWYYLGPFGLFWEWVSSNQELARVAGKTTEFQRADNKAWQVATSYFLTGEDNQWKPVAPRNNFNFSGEGWGALELAARVSQLNLDPDLFPLYANSQTSITEALEWAVGLNWYLNRNIKFSVDYSNTHYTGGNLNPITSNDESVILSQVQFSF